MFFVLLNLSNFTLFPLFMFPSTSIVTKCRIECATSFFGWLCMKNHLIESSNQTNHKNRYNLSFLFANFFFGGLLPNGKCCFAMYVLRMKFVFVFVNKHNYISILEKDDNSSLGGLLSSS